MEPFPFKEYPLKKSSGEPYESQLHLPAGYEHLAGPHAVPKGFPTSIATPNFQHVGVPDAGVSFERSLPLSSSLAVPLGFSVDDTSGKKFVVKQARNVANMTRDPLGNKIKVGSPRPGEATRHEALANRLYRFFGYAAPASQLYDGLTGEPVKKDHDFGDELDAKDPYVAAHAPYLVSEHLGDRSRSLGGFYSKFIRGNDHPSKEHALRQFLQTKRDFARGAIFDAIMGNYDMHVNNIGLDGKEKSFDDPVIPWRWDVGASLGFNPHGDKKKWDAWGAPATHRSVDILPSLIAILRHDHDARYNEEADGHFSTYSMLHDDHSIYSDLIDEMHRISNHAHKHKATLQQMFSQLPNGEFHYNTFMDRIQSVDNMLKTFGTPQKLYQLIQSFVVPHGEAIERLFAPSPGPYRPPGAEPLGRFERIKRKVNPLLGRYRSIGQRSYW